MARWEGERPMKLSPADISPADIVDAGKVWKHRRTLLPGTRVPGGVVTVLALLPSLNAPETADVVAGFWVHWVGTASPMLVRDGDFPPDTNEYVLARMDGPMGRAQSWLFPNCELAQALVRALWALSFDIPPDLRSAQA